MPLTSASSPTRLAQHSPASRKWAALGDAGDALKGVHEPLPSRIVIVVNASPKVFQLTASETLAHSFRLTIP
jgi:hypothetical protein